MCLLRDEITPELFMVHYILIKRKWYVQRSFIKLLELLILLTNVSIKLTKEMVECENRKVRSVGKLRGEGYICIPQTFK